MAPDPVCIVCGADDIETLLGPVQVPVLSNELHPTPEAAASAPRGVMGIEFCPRCGHFFNGHFDPTLISYSSNYETSLHYSDVFVDYVDGVIGRLVDDWGVRDGHVLEVGCGRGEFLHALCRAGNNRGSGFDTSWSPEHATDDPTPGVTIVPEYFDASMAIDPVDLIVSQQQLEHVEEPRVFLENLFDNPATRGSMLYLEVPNGLWTFEAGGIWDLIYEHVSYFTRDSLVRVVADAGAEVVEAGETFGGQYLYVVAKVDGTPRPTPHPTLDFTFLEGFADRFETTIASWRERIADPAFGASSTYVWGAGSKGITFCNIVDPEARLGGLVDRHPNKAGKYIATTALDVIGPDDLVDRDVSQVIVMNHLYRDEIAADLAERGIDPRIVGL